VLTDDELRRAEELGLYDDSYELAQLGG